MSGFTVRLTGPWKEAQYLFRTERINEPQFRQSFSVGVQVTAKVILREIRQNIKRGNYAGSRTPNAPLTRAIKRSSLPLADRGQLFKAITSKPIDWHSVEIGVVKGDDRANIALIVHEGVQIPVTDKMRRMFQALAEASDGGRSPSTLTGRAAELWARMSGGWKALRASTDVIRIPPRPFIREVIEHPAIERFVAENLLKTTQRAIAGLPVTAAHLKTQV